MYFELKALSYTYACSTLSAHRLSGVAGLCVSTRVHVRRSRVSKASPVSHASSKGTGAFIDSSRLNCEPLLSQALDQTRLQSAHGRTDVWFA